MQNQWNAHIAELIHAADEIQDKGVRSDWIAFLLGQLV